VVIWGLFCYFLNQPTFILKFYLGLVAERAWVYQPQDIPGLSLGVVFQKLNPQGYSSFVFHLCLLY